MTDLVFLHQMKRDIEDSIFKLYAVKDGIEFSEKEEIDKCLYYNYDDSAFEEYCNCPSIMWKGDFHSKEECWKCKYRDVI
jgi:hypothetical protein